MKKKLVILLLALIIGCAIYGDNDPRPLRAVLDQTGIVDGWFFYWWQGDDTLQFTLGNMAVYDTVMYDGILMDVPSDTMSQTYNYMMAGAKSFLVDNGVYTTSEITLSRFYAYHEFFPVPPDSVRIKKPTMP